MKRDAEEQQNKTVEQGKWWTKTRFTLASQKLARGTRRCLVEGFSMVPALVLDKPLVAGIRGRLGIHTAGHSLGVLVVGD